MKTSQKYKAMHDKYVAEAEKYDILKTNEKGRLEVNDSANPEQYKKFRNLAKIAYNHFARAARNEHRTDHENRVLCNNYEWVPDNPLSLRRGKRKIVDRLKDDAPHLSDDVYKKLHDLWVLRTPVFEQFKEQKPFKYKNNSRKRPKLKQHREAFRSAVFNALRSIENRTMKEPDYNAIRDDLDAWAMQLYIDTREQMDREEEELEGMSNEEKLHRAIFGR